MAKRILYNVQQVGYFGADAGAGCKEKVGNVNFSGYHSLRYPLVRLIPKGKIMYPVGDGPVQVSGIAKPDGGEIGCVVIRHRHGCTGLTRFGRLSWLAGDQSHQ